MYQYNKIAKDKKIIYSVAKNTQNSKHYLILCDFSKSAYADKVDNPYETCVAWFDKHKNIEWNDETESYINKDMIKHFVINTN